MAIKRLNNRPKKTLSAEQKTAFVLLVVLGVGGVFFGAKSFGANLMRPIQQQIVQIYETEPLVTSSELEAQELEESKTKDTDGDGLVDYDELYVFRTSPYLADSDSDGFDDMQEVYSGNDPNCPTGNDCGVIASEEAGNTASTNIGGLIDPFNTGESDGILDTANIEFSNAEEVEAFFKQATFEEIRNALIATGMSEEELDLIDNETLEQLFDEQLDNATESGALDELVTDSSDVTSE